MTIASDHETSLRVPARPGELNAEWSTTCLRRAGVLRASAREAGIALERIGERRGFCRSDRTQRAALRTGRPERATPHVRRLASNDVT